MDTLAGKPLVVLAGLAHRGARLFRPPRPAAREAGRIGVVCLGAIGDLLLATALLSGLRRELPEATIEVITIASDHRRAQAPIRRPHRLPKPR